MLFCARCDELLPDLPGVGGASGGGAGSAGGGLIGDSGGSGGSGMRKGGMRKGGDAVALLAPGAAVALPRGVMMSEDCSQAWALRATDDASWPGGTLPIAATLRSFELAVVMLAVVDTPDAPGRCVTEPDGGGELGGSGRTSIVGMLPLRLGATAVGPD